MSREKILLVQLFSNGDCLLATTIARQIKTNYTNCELTWIVSSKCKSMLMYNPDIDKIHEVIIPDKTENESMFLKVIIEAFKKKEAGLYSQVIVPQLLVNNMKYYDGTIWSSMVRSSGLKITVEKSPFLFLTTAEKKKAEEFANFIQVKEYKNIVLFECAPQTNQLQLTDEIILNYSKQIVKQENTCIILSSPQAYCFNEPHIFDGNILSIRETVAFTHFCTILLGCSSGISWAATSNAAKPLKFVQLLSSNTYYFNPLSITFKKWQRSLDSLIELLYFDELLIGRVFQDIFTKGFDTARMKHHQQVKIKFKLHRGIIYHFLLKKKISEIVTFLKINIKENGWDFSMLKFIFLGFALFPFQWIWNKFKLY